MTTRHLPRAQHHPQRKIRCSCSNSLSCVCVCVCVCVCLCVCIMYCYLSVARAMYNDLRFVFFLVVFVLMSIS